MFYPSYEQVKNLAEDYQMIPIMAEYYADTETPISVFQKLRTEKNCFLLESVEQHSERARYSFLGRNPFLVFESRGNQITVTTDQGEQNLSGNPMESLQQLTQQYKAPKLEESPGFCGGAVGCFGYDTIRLFERLENPPEDSLHLPDLKFLFVDEVIAFDHQKQKLVIIVNMRTGGNLQRSYDMAQRRIIEIKQELDQAVLPRKKQTVRYREQCQVESNMTKQEYCTKVEKAKEYIRNGDIFQVVFAQQFKIQTSVNPFNAYRALRVINPSPYMYFFDFGDYQVAGASPELLVRVQDGVVTTCPIAGSRPRGKTAREDLENEKDLVADPKENAEHTMLVDLGRNDIGKVSEFGSVQVSKYKYIQRFSHIMHMTSDVQGKLRKDKTPFDALASVLPAGTLSGAPKVRAMEIIDELETKRRGLYGGAIGYIGFDGNFDSCITIRTGVFQNNTCYVGAGGGIVYDSNPETEYQESVNKATAVFRAVEEAAEMA